MFCTFPDCFNHLNLYFLRQEPLDHGEFHLHQHDFVAASGTTVALGRGDSTRARPSGLAVVVTWWLIRVEMIYSITMVNDGEQ